MKKSAKRILCGALSMMMLSSLVLERALSSAESGAQLGQTATANATFKNVTGQFDTTKLMESYFNDSVLKSEDTAPKYETRTVIVTLSGKNVVESADGENVTEYISSRDGKRAAEAIESEQDRFLNALSQKEIAYELVRSYNTVLNGVAIEIDTQYVSEIKKMSGVESVVITTAYAEPKTVAAASAEGDLVTNETNVYKTGIYDSSEYAAEYGEGTVVAVLDTGLDYTHPAFQSFESADVEPAWDMEDVKAKLDNEDLVAETRSGSLEVSDVYMNDKVPFAYDYADDDPDVYPSYSNHGTHVAGIIGGYDTSGYTDKDGNPIDETFKGVVPDAQLAIFKVFTDDLDDPDLGGAVAEDIIAALEDCVKIGVDVINMSLGTSCGFTTTDDGDSEGEMLNAVYERIKDAGIGLICAASNDYSAGYGGVYGTNLASNPDSGTVGSPSTFSAALSVASVNGQKASYMIANEGDNQSYVFYEESRDINGNPFDFYKDLNERYPDKNGVFEYVVVPGIGQAADYSTSVRRLFKDANGNSLDRIALVKRGDSTFQEKVEIAMEMGAIGVIVYNNVAGVIRMNLGEINDPVPSVSINMNAGNAMVEGAKTDATSDSRVGTVKLAQEQKAGPFMSEFSSWGPTHDLKLKPEITAHGGEITSTVPGGYGEQSGTSMASPNMAGFMALVRSYIKNDLAITDPVEINRLAMQLVMSTATTAYDQDGLAYSPRKQGAGLARMERVIDETQAYLWTDVEENDYRPKIEIGDDPARTGVYEMRFKVTNFGESELNFSTDQIVMTETLSSDKLTVSEQAHMLSDSEAVWTVDGSEVNAISVAAGATKEIKVTITLAESEKAYIEESFENGMYVEGFLKLNSETNGQCDLSIPFLGFYGNWEDAPMLDYTAFEVAENEQDASVKEEDKIQASVWATQPYTSYYNEQYILPMGGYVYLLPDDADPVYVDEDKCSVSRYNIYYGEGEEENYLTSTSIKAVYAGLLRNARLVKYRLYSEETGELILEDVCNRVGKAYAGGGSGTPANVELELSPEAEDLAANGKYRMEFEFFMDTPEEGETAREENTYEFSFTVDYEAPILEDVRVRYYNYKENNKEKQRIYLDVDVYDNHYAQAIMLCYPKTDANGDVSLMLATDYPTPVRDANPNGTTTVSIEITDIYEKYGSQLYVQIDDYAVNSCLYQVNIAEANKDSISDVKDFDLVESDKLTVNERGEGELTLNVYETYKVGLTNVGSGDASNFIWSSDAESIASVKNGEIVGLMPGATSILVSSGSGTPKIVNVTVTETYATLPSVPSVSFGIIKTAQEALTNATGVVEVNAGQAFNIPLKTDPWYHPMTDLRLVWSSTDETVATVDQNGNVETLKKGTAIILASVERKNAKGEWEKTLYSTSVTLRVQNEFTVSNYTLIDYNGVGGEVVIPTDLNIWYIGEEAFKDNDNITKIVLPASVIDIRERAFENCTALEEVYFVSEDHRVDENGDIIEYESGIIDWADLAMIYENAFYGCTNLQKIDFSNVKTVTVAQYAFGNCPQLEEVVDMPSIGTMHHFAFAGTALKSVDLTGLHMSGDYVFAGCTELEEIKTGKFTAIGNYMFYACTGLRETVTLSTPKIGDGAFSNCINLSGVKLDGLGENLSFAIGANAFENCGSNLRGINFTADLNGETVRSIGDKAFAGSTLRTFEVPAGLETFGENVFANTAVKTLVIDNDTNFKNIRFLGVPFSGMTVELATENSDQYVLEDGVLYDAGKTTVFHVNPSVTAVTLPGSVTEIGAYAFAGSNVRSVALTQNVTALGVGAFENSALAEINFNGANVTEIPESVFQGTKLPSIALPESVTKLGAYAFADSSISNITADGLTEIGSYAFRNCIALRGELVENAYALTLADGVKTMGDGVFNGCIALTTVNMPSVETLGRFTFRGATSLREVNFGEAATTVGEYTFMNTRVESVTLGNALETIEQGAFFGCNGLEEITLPDTVNTIADYAFQNCRNLKRVNGIENVETFGMQAFYESGIETLNLESAITIGDFAFGSQPQSNAMAYGSINMPNIVTIGRYAFFNGGERALSLPASLQSVGYGAFAASEKLVEISVSEDNTRFFVEDGVLYRSVSEDGYEAVCYPAALKAAETDGVKVYAIKEGTLRVNAYAFYGLNEGSLEKVVLPHTLNAIGDSAFFESGVTEYTFESIEAPVLETVFRQEIADSIQAASTTAYYKGYYYSNFQTYLYNFTSYVREESELVMNYPANGKGYDNYIYSLYFGVKNAGDVLPEDETRAFIALMDSFPEVSAIEAWLNEDSDNATVKAEVEALSESVKTARRYFNNASGKAAQLAFVEEYETALTAVEAALRSVKQHFGVTIRLSELRVASESTHKTTYVEGDVFDMTGLVVELVYDDESTEIAEFSKLELDTTEALSTLDRFVTVKYEGKKLRVQITVTEAETDGDGNEEETDSSSSEVDSSEEEGGCGSVIDGGMLAIATLTLLSAGMACLKGKKDE